MVQVLMVPPAYRRLQRSLPCQLFPGPHGPRGTPSGPPNRPASCGRSVSPSSRRGLPPTRPRGAPLLPLSGAEPLRAGRPPRGRSGLSAALVGFPEAGTRPAPHQVVAGPGARLAAEHRPSSLWQPVSASPWPRRNTFSPPAAEKEPPGWMRYRVCSVSVCVYRTVQALILLFPASFKESGSLHPDKDRTLADIRGVMPVVQRSAPGKAFH